jgi:hypothetical protein
MLPPKTKPPDPACFPPKKSGKRSPPDNLRGDPLFFKSPRTQSCRIRMNLEWKHAMLIQDDYITTHLLFVQSRIS